jgi:hypothetical protein
MATAPRGLKAGGRRLLVPVTTDFDLDESASAVLTEAAYTVDLLAELRAKLADNSVLIDSNQGVRVHPLIVEVRQQRLALGKLIASIGLPRHLVDDESA